MARNWKQRRHGPPKPKPAPAPADTEADTLTGVVETVVFHSEETHYTVCRVKVAGQRDTATVVGNCAAVWEGETLRATGAWTRHRQHGFQFQAESIQCVPPTSARGIERYLASGMIRGIGKELARRLVKKFGEDTLRIIEKESRRLEEVEGIGPTRRSMIKESWAENKGVRDIMIFLQGHGIGAGQAARIYRRYGDQSVALIKQDPYRLCREVWGVGFKTADGLAMNMGIPPQSEARARAGIIYVLDTMTDEGHCYCPVAEIMLQAEDLLGIPVETLTAALAVEVHERRLTKEDDRVYLTYLHKAECEAADKLRHLMRTKSAFKPIIVEKAVPWASRRMKLDFAPKQREALEMALREKVSIMTGGPGVGKTTIIRALVEVFSARMLGVCLAAPTGRAAKRMEEATGHPAKTIHRLLKYQPQTGQFEHNADNLLEGNVFILDEVSMIDIRLMRDFLVALPDQSCLVLVGDIDQLPSVGPGNVLRDLIHSGCVPCTKLDTIFRQESGGWIIRNAHRVNEGEWLETPAAGATSDFYFIEKQEPETVINTLLSLVTERIPRRFGFNPMNDVQVLTPMRRNQLGSENLNAVLQEHLNPSGEALERYGRKYRRRDRVMQIRNNYDKDVFNGDIGHIVRIDKEEMRLLVDFDGRKIGYDVTELDELVHAYACTIHKSQGSEYPAVVILMTTQHFKLLQRNLLYTALTRGRNLVCLVGSRKALFIAIKNNEIRLRRTGLRERVVARNG